MSRRIPNIIINIDFYNINISMLILIMEDIVNKINTTDDIYNIISNMSIDVLEKFVLFASDKYYNDSPVITDAVFDMMVDFLREKKPKSKILKQIGAPVKSKNKVNLPYYLGSMDKIKPPSNKLNKWKEEYEAPYILTDKLDGVSGLLVYSNNMTKLYTRGTATMGMDISILLNYMMIPSYETVIKQYPKMKMISFRGELIISKVKFEKKWASTMKNGRNAIAGLVNSKTINPMLAHDTDFVVYQVVDPIMTMSDQLDIMKKLGFKTVHSKIIQNKDDLSFEKLSSNLLKRRDKSKYIIDGIIVTNDVKHPINTSGNPEYAFAFKDVLEDQKALSTVTNVEWNESKDGNLIPTIVIMPKDVGGVTITRITGNNARFIVEMKIGIGAEIEVIRSNDVIPKIERVIKGVIPSLPKGDDWEWSESGVHIISTNMESSNKMIKNIYHFFSTLEAVGMGEKIVERIYNAGYTKIEDILQITKEDLLSIDGFKEKSAQNTINSITKCTTDIPLVKLMVASNKLGHGMGTERLKSVISYYPDILENSKKYEKLPKDKFIDMLKEIDGWDTITSTLFVSNFSDFLEFYNSIKKYITIDNTTKIPTGNKYVGMKIVMSGFRNKELEEYIVNEGGIITNTISKNTDILIIKDKGVSDTSKVIKAKDLGIKIYTLDQIMQSGK